MNILATNRRGCGQSLRLVAVPGASQTEAAHLFRIERRGRPQLTAMNSSWMLSGSRNTTVE